MKRFRTADALHRGCLELIDRSLDVRKRSREEYEKGQHLIRHSQQLKQDIILLRHYRDQAFSQVRQIRASTETLARSAGKPELQVHYAERAATLRSSVHANTHPSGRRLGGLANL